MLRAVLDANVYISALIRPGGPPGQILGRLLSATAFDAVLSPAIIDEVQRALAYPKIRKLVRSDLDPRLWFEDIMVLADLVADTRLARAVCADPDDDKYIAAAIEGRAAYVVTGDDRLLAVNHYEGVRVIAPRPFRTLLGA